MGPDARTWIFATGSLPVPCGGTLIVCRLKLPLETLLTDDQKVVKPTLERAQPVYAVSEQRLGPTEQIVAAVTGSSVGRPQNDTKTPTSDRTDTGTAASP